MTGGFCCEVCGCRSLVPGMCSRCADARIGAGVARERSAAIHHPPHYGGADDPYEAAKVIRAWGLNWGEGNALKYIRRAGKKPGETRLTALEKALESLRQEVEAERARG